MHPPLSGMKERRATMKADLGRLNESIPLAATASSGRELRKKFESGVAELKALDDRIEEIQEEELRESVAAKHRVDLGLIDGGTDNPTGATRGQWVRTNDMRPAAVLREQRFADHEIVRDHSRQVSGRESAVIGQHGSFGQMVRSMSTTSGAALVPTIWASDVIDRARNFAAVLKAGASVVPMDAKIVQIGRLTADPTAAFRSEGSTITASDPTFDNVT